MLEREKVERENSRRRGQLHRVAVTRHRRNDDTDEKMLPYSSRIDLVQNVLERDSVLRYMFVARFPHKRNIASIGGLKSPREKGRNWVTAN